MQKIADSNTSALIKAGLRTVASIVPGGSAIAQAWNEYESHKKNERIDEFFAAFGALLRDARADFSRMDSETKEQIPTLIERAVEKIQREASDCKRRLFAVAVANNVIGGSNRDYDDKLNVLDCLDGLTEADVAILNRISQNSSTPVWSLAAAEDRNDLMALGKLAVSLQKLEARGLIAEADPFTGMDSLSRSHWISRFGGRNYQMLPFGKMLLDSIAEPTPRAATVLPQPV